jgi:non-ribosomal peptide synthetase component F
MHRRLDADRHARANQTARAPPIDLRPRASCLRHLHLGIDRADQRLRQIPIAGSSIACSGCSSVSSGRRRRVLQKTARPVLTSRSGSSFWPLLTGARLVVAAPGGTPRPGQSDETIRRTGVTTLHFVPSMLQAFWRTTERGIVPGCAALSAAARRFQRGSEIVLPRSSATRDLQNLYGTDRGGDRRHTLGPARRPLATSCRSAVRSGTRGFMSWTVVCEPVPAGVSGSFTLRGLACAGLCGRAG